MWKYQLFRGMNQVFQKCGFQVLPVRTNMRVVFDPAGSYMEDPAFRQQVRDELTAVAKNHFQHRLGERIPVSMDFAAEVDRFFDVYANRPFTCNEGGSGFHNAFWLFLSARALDAELIVESGVWKGHTTWLLEQACPCAEVVGFDLNARRVEYRDGRAVFHEHDIVDYAFGEVNPERSLIYFDCHVNHAARILQAKERGFKHVFFDDDCPARYLYAYGAPGFPTAKMLWDGVESYSDSPVVWRREGKAISKVMNIEEAQAARRLMQVHEHFPDVGSSTLFGGYSYLSYVGL